MKYAILTVSLLIQVCLGGLYAWSSFVPALQASHGLSTAQTQVIFGVLILVFAVATIPAGRLLNYRGPRLVAIIGGLLFGTGYLIASRSGSSFAVLLTGISLVAGVGIGFGYVCPLTTCVRWFPKHKGLVTGISVAGFGGGAAFLAALTEVFFARGWDILTVFQWVGISYGVVILVSASVLRFPESGEQKRSRLQPATGILLRDPFFWALATGMFSGTFAGLLIIGNLKPLALSRGIAITPAVMAISTLALGNAAGRITWGWVADRLGKQTIPVALGFLALTLCVLLPATTAAEFILASALIGFGFGACFVVYVTQVASRYGVDQVGSIYPWVFLSYGVSGIAGPFIGGRLYDISNSYIPSIGVSISVVLAGLLIGCRLLREEKPSEHLFFRCPSSELMVQKQ